MKFSHKKFTVIGLAAASLIHASYAMADDDESKKKGKTSNLSSQVSDFYASIPQLEVPDCRIGTGWVGPGNGLGYSHCLAAGPATTTKPRKGMTAVEVCALNSGAGYAWTDASQTCAIPVVRPNGGSSNPNAPAGDNYGGGGDYYSGPDIGMDGAADGAAGAADGAADGAGGDAGAGGDGGGGGGDGGGGD